LFLQSLQYRLQDADYFQGGFRIWPKESFAALLLGPTENNYELSVHWASDSRLSAFKLQAEVGAEEILDLVMPIVMSAYDS
jgi:hypothetical protein